MDLLILGGTGQLGRHIVSAALDSGHSVTCLARGTNPAPGGAQLVRADRDLPHPYREVEGTRWDAVVELASAPGRVREATSSITADHWLYAAPTWRSTMIAWSWALVWLTTEGVPPWYDYILGVHRQTEQWKAMGMRARLRPCARISIIGSTKDAVLPVPVWAMPMMSRIISTLGIADAWIGVGSV